MIASTSSIGLPSLLLPGYRLLGPFQETGTNVIYRAVRESDGLPVIVKTPRSRHPGPRERARYQREYELLRHLRGTPGVLAVHGHEVLQERPVLLLEDVGGTALSEQVGQPLEPSRFLSLALSLAGTLAEVHRRGVIHKDIKPANILVSPEGKAWLIDFGIATLQRVEHVEAVLQYHLVEGTPAYMSPEQSGRMNRAVDYRTDFYSLGMSFFEMLTGRLPFRGQDVLEWFHAHLAQAPLPPHQVVPSIPPALSAVVMKLLAKVAEERYQSAEGLRADLERCQEALRNGALEPFPLGSQDFSARFLLPQRLYGREAEVDTLLEAFERVVRTQRAECVLVRGYSGIGKSAVIGELHRPVLRRRGFFLRGKFDQLQRDVPYSTLAQAIQELVRQLLAGSDEEVAAWRQRLLEAWEGNGQVLVDLVPQLERIAGAQPALSALPSLEARNRFHRVFQRFLGVFATPERPLVLFLDDLQWADIASLELLRYLATHLDTPPLLLIGAYRDNEVSPSHPLARTLEEMRKAGTRWGDIHLSPLSLVQTRQLVADAFPGASEELVVPLSSLVQEKTRGNPFFLLQLLQTLHLDGLVVRAPGGGWRWDAEGVRARGYSDNVIDFMTGRLLQLTAGTRQLLSLAACMGNAFPLDKLALLSQQDASRVEQGLEPALQEEMLVRTEAGQYRFRHDRIQQAAYAFIPEAERKAVHLRLGRLLLERLSPEELHERLFDVVAHLNAGVELMEEARERSRLALLNAEAGWRAKAANAYRSAVACFTTAFSLLPANPWEEEGALAFQLRLDQAACELSSGNATEARRLLDELLPRARTRANLAAAYGLESELLIASSDAPGAVTCLLECLKAFGMPLPPNPTWEEVMAANDEVWSLLGERPIESLVDLPPMSNPDLKAAMSVLAALSLPTFFSGGNLFVLHICRMVSLSIRHGCTDASAHAYAWFGFVNSNAFGRYREGHTFSTLACELAERQGFSARSGQVFLIRGLIEQWVRPFSIARERFREASQRSVLTGDLQSAGYCYNNLVALQLAMGRELADTHQETVAGHDFAVRAGSWDVAQMMLICQRYAQQLRGLSESFLTLDGDGFEEKAFEAQLATRGLSSMRCCYAIMKMQSRFLCGAHEEARLAAVAATELIWSTDGQLFLYFYHLYRALILAACHRDAPPPRQQEYREAIERHRKQLAEWANHCPENFRAAERLVAAELARLEDRPEGALRAYEESIRSARDQGMLQNVALASELAARFWKERGMPTTATAFAREAREAWRQWGAEGKVSHMDEQWPLLAPPAARGGSDSTTSYDTDSTHLDALTVIKAQQAISREIVLEKLADTLVRVALENAGAQRGALLLLREGALGVAALADTTRDQASPAEEDAQRLPWTLLRYVRRSGEHVLIHDTSQPHPFSTDPYFSSSQARCVLCLPLWRQEELSGCLYLENGLAIEAFSPKRIALLRHIASQAAISVENARLYAEVQRAETALRRSNDELERRVEERTHALKQAQAHLMETARVVGMAEIASNILHEAGNALTSVVVDTDLLRRTVGASRVDRVKRVAMMLEDNRDGLADFLTRDARGSLLPDYLSGLAGELVQEQAVLQRSLESLDAHVGRVRDIIQMQRTYAKSTLLTDECDLAGLVEEALRHQLASRRFRVSVTRELAALPKVRVDRHRVLQILTGLLNNACDALEPVPEEARRLSVRLSAEDGWARIQVVDNGKGLAPEAREHLFSQGFGTSKSGHGIGLHASSLAARLLGGRLTLESDGLGQGAIATLELPIGV